MKDGLMDITILVDRSGSMSSIKSDMEGGFAQFLKEQKEQEDCDKKLLSLYQFDGDYDKGVAKLSLEEVYAGKAIQEAGELALVPRNMTPLLDALGTVINKTFDRLSKMKEEDRPAKVLFVTITDGLENFSTEFKKPQILEKIKHQETNYNWKFVYVGANQDAISEGRGLGYHQGSSLTYAATRGGTKKMFGSLSAATSGLACMNAAQYDASVKTGQTFSDKDREEQKEELTIS